MELYYTITGTISAILLVAVTIDQIYQRLSHKWTNEPPLLPYLIPIIGHGLAYGSDSEQIFRSARFVDGVIPIISRI